MRKRRDGRRLLGAVIASAGLHLAVFAVLVTSPDPPSDPPPPRPVEVTLLRPERRPAQETAERPAPEARADEAGPVNTPALTDVPFRTRSPRFLLPAGAGGFRDGLAESPPAATGSAAPNLAPPATPARAPAPALGSALRAADCDEQGRRRSRDGCDERLGAVGRAAAPLPPDPNARLQAEAAGRTAAVAAKEAGRLRPLPGGACPSCGGMSVVSGEGPPTNLSDNGMKIPFGRITPAVTPIPPSTLRGDDDALRPKPRP